MKYKWYEEYPDKMEIGFQDSEDNYFRLKAKYEVCPTCRGKGTHVNRNIDGNGITQEEMYELGDDFFEDYMAGVYDVICEECNGKRVVLVPDEDKDNNREEILDIFYREAEAVYDSYADERAEQRYFSYFER